MIRKETQKNELSILDNYLNNNENSSRKSLNLILDFLIDSEWLS